MVDADNLGREFERVFGRPPQLYRAPGRVNLIGEHTDYNDGFVMPMALDRSTWIAAAPRSDGRLVVRSRELAEQPLESKLTLSLSKGARRHVHHWSDYLRGVAIVLESPGADMLIASDVPIGAGLSSSAALEVACGYALLDLAGKPIRGEVADEALDSLARACQRAEHEYAGIRCGIMDQMIACHGRAGHAMMLDTRSLARRDLPLPSAVRVIVCNTKVKHQLAGGEYNARRADCEEGVRILARTRPEVRALRDVTLDQLEAARADMAERVYRRCRHVISENARVEEAAAALGVRDFEMFGRLMNASHQSLRDDYEVSCAELDTMVGIALGLDGVFGARMTGGGFGGSAIALAEADAADRLRQEIAARYATETGLQPDIWICAAGPGVGPVPVRATHA